MTQKPKQKRVTLKDLQDFCVHLNQRVQSLNQTLASIAQNNDVRSLRTNAFLMSLEQIFDNPSFWENLDIESKLKEKQEQLAMIQGKTYPELENYFKGMKEEVDLKQEQLHEKYKKWEELVEANYLYELEIFQIQIMERQRRAMMQQEELGLQVEDTEEDTDEETVVVPQEEVVEGTDTVPAVNEEPELEVE